MTYVYKSPAARFVRTVLPRSTMRRRIRALSGSSSRLSFLESISRVFLDRGWPGSSSNVICVGRSGIYSARRADRLSLPRIGLQGLEEDSIQANGPSYPLRHSSQVQSESPFHEDFEKSGQGRKRLYPS